ncbi:hypothetical protein [Nonomuraea typhae]|uniref:Uncharacterized protein n=1 Tax=Nonomuraea typhae TaxID=2603600 RepID=A0ABW7YTU2_9ACTN
MDFKVDYPDRKFRLWIYTPSHSKLLLRSGLETSGTTTIDIAFGDVSAVSLPVSMNGLTIEAPDAQSARAVADQLGSHLDPDRLLVVRGQGYRGYVVASIVEMDEHHRRLRERDKWGIIPQGGFAGFSS